jgi:multidrug efflux pump subunit AcrB
MNEKKPITLSGLHGGAVVEAVDHEIQNVLANITDVNTSKQKARTVTLTLTFKPNKERNIADVTFQAKSALAPAEALETSIIIDRNQAGQPVAFELTKTNPHNQGVLPIFGEQS